MTHSRRSFKVKGFGDKSLDRLNQWLENHGLSFRKTASDMTDEELLNSPEGLKQDYDIEFNLEDLFIKISSLKGKFLELEPRRGEQIFDLLDRAGKKTIFDLLTSEYDIFAILNRNWDLFTPLIDFFKKNYNIDIHYCSPGSLEQITRWYNAKLKSPGEQKLT